MSLQDNLFVEEVENDVILFAKEAKRKRVLIFPPTNNYRRFLIHQFIQENFSELFNTFSIGQGLARRTVVCYKSDIISDLKLNGVPPIEQSGVKCSSFNMVVERPRSPLTSPENSRQRQVKSMPAVEIYRPPAARQQRNIIAVTETDNSSLPTKTKQRRPDRAVYIPKARRSIDSDGTSLVLHDEGHSTKSNRNGRRSKLLSGDNCTSLDTCEISTNNSQNNVNAQRELSELHQCDDISLDSVSMIMENQKQVSGYFDQVCSANVNSSLENNTEISKSVFVNGSDYLDNGQLECQGTNESLTELEICYDVVGDNHDTINTKENDNASINKNENIRRNIVSDVLIISNSDSDKSTENNVADDMAIVPLRSPEKKTKKVARTKSKPAIPPTSPVKINRDECDWDSLFDDNGECLDPTLIEELTAAVGKVTIEQPKNVCKTFNRSIEVSSDEFAHVVEIYNFPSDFKTSDLAAVFSPFKNGGFELKWVDDTHCLGVFSSPLVAAEVLASDHQFVKTRPLSEATALSRAKARRSAEFLQPYRSRPETCAALARRLVTGALGVKLATARQEREHEKVLLREAKERRRLANKQREDAWEGIIAQK